MSEALRKRIITALVLAASLLWVLFGLPPWATVLLLTALVLAGSWEWSAFLGLKTVPARAVYVAAVAVLLLLAWRYATWPPARDAVLTAALAWWLGALGWVVFAPHRVTRIAAGAAGFLALVPAWLALVLLRLQVARGAEWMCFVLLLVWMADIGAYFVGRRYGRVRLAPEVSPGKTWEGVAGGAALSLAVAVGGTLWFGMPPLAFVPLCLGVVAFSVVGDLTESLLKRFAGMKDSGSLFPGHGGVMDRIDSVTGAAPVMVLGLTLLGVLR